MGPWSPTIQLEPLTTEFELKGLQPDVEYSIVVRLLNEAGVGEQKIIKRTSRSRIGKRCSIGCFLFRSLLSCRQRFGL